MSTKVETIRLTISGWPVDVRYTRHGGAMCPQWVEFEGASFPAGFDAGGRLDRAEIEARVWAAITAADRAENLHDTREEASGDR